MSASRNTKTHRLCRECHGAGERVFNNSNPHGYGPDPQQDEAETCGDCNGRGWIRTAPVDPLVLLQKVRRERYRMFPLRIQQYGALRQLAVSPVLLP